MSRNSMEEKQLDFNAPLMSVRRFSSVASSSSSSPSSLVDDNNSHKRTENSHYQVNKKRTSVPPPYKSDLKSGPMRHPGAVPFIWEQIPGKPKEEGGGGGGGSGVPNPQFRSVDRPPVTPRLPPGRRVREVEVRQSFEKEFKDPVVVIKPQLDNVVVTTNHRGDLISDANAIEFESSKEGLKEKKGGSVLEEDENDDAFMDAPDTLSRSESFFFNCSISGVSGLDGADAKPSGTFSTDPQTRDFMMGRFLPAAKAMTTETPQYAIRRQPMVREQPRQVNRVVNVDRKLPLYQYQPNAVPADDVWEEDSEDEDEDEDDEDYDDTRNLSAKACGLFPRFCIRNSLFLMNPVPGMKVRRRAPAASVRKVRTQARNAHSGSLGKPVDEHNWESVYKHKSMTVPELPDEESKLRSESNQLTCLSGSQTPDGSSHYSHSGDGGISPYRNEATQSPFHEGVGFLGIPKQDKNSKCRTFDPYKKGTNEYHEIVPYHSSKEGSGASSPMVEKTLYVDSVNVVENPRSCSSSSDMKGSMDFNDKNSDSVVYSRQIEDTPVEESFLQGINHLNISKDHGSLQSKVTDDVGGDLQTSFHYSNLGQKIDSTERFRKDDRVSDGNIEFHNPQSLKADDQENLSLVPFRGPLPPPLPKSPSESWLWRTLPSVSSRHGTKISQKQAPKKSSVGPKWETIVKTSNVHHSHLRFSEEQIPHISQKPET